MAPKAEAPQHKGSDRSEGFGWWPWTSAERHLGDARVQQLRL